MQTQEITHALRSLKTAHKTNWRASINKVEGVLPILTKRLEMEIVPFRTSSDITEEVTAADFEAAGFSAAESQALLFILTQDCMGQAVVSTDLIDRWFEYCA